MTLGSTSLYGLAILLYYMICLKSKVVILNQFSSRCRQPDLKARPEQSSDDKTSFLLICRDCMRQEGKYSKRFSPGSAGKTDGPPRQWLCRCSSFSARTSVWFQISFSFKRMRRLEQKQCFAFSFFRPSVVVAVKGFYAFLK